VLEIKAPMGGKIVKISVSAGDQVQEDEELAVLEAMKMEMPLMSEHSGKVGKIAVSAGDTVEADQVIMLME
jgi:biotin carboxyl carrier protein